MSVALTPKNVKTWIDRAIEGFRTKDLVGVSDPWLKIYEALSAYISSQSEVDDKLLWMIEGTDDSLPDVIYLLQRLKNALVQEVVAAEAFSELDRVLSWFDRLVVTLTEKLTGEMSRDRYLSKPYEAIFWKARDGMYISTVEGRFLHCNEALVEMLKYGSLEETRKMDIQADLYVNKEEREIMLKHLQTDGFYDHHEFHFRCADGEIKTALESCYTVEVPGAKYIVGIMVDVTKEKETQKKSETYIRNIEEKGVQVMLDLRRSSQRYEAILNVGDDPLILVEPKKFMILETNQAFKKRFKYRKKQIKGMTFRDLFEPDEWMKIYPTVSNMLHRHHYHIRDLRFRDGEGEVFRSECSVLVHQDDMDCVLFIQIKDLTEVLRIKAKLDNQLKNLDKTLKGIPLGVIGFRSDGSVALINQFLHDFTGYGNRQLKSVSFVHRLFERDEHRLKFHKYVRQFLRGNHAQNVVVELKAKSGDILQFRLTTISFHFDGDSKPGFLALLSNISNEIALKAMVNKQDSGPQDTDKARLALEKQLRSLRSSSRALSQKNKFWEQLTQSLTQKFKIPIHVVLGYASLLKKDLAGIASESQQEDIRIVENHIQDLLHMVQKTAAYIRLVNGEINPIMGLHPVRNMIDRLFDALIPESTAKGVSFVTDRQILSLDVKIECDPVLLEAMLAELVENAVLNTLKGTISLTAFEEQNRLWIEVIDEGVGMSPTDLPQVFQPFFQIAGEGKNVDRGLGVGLASAKKYSDLMGVTLEIDSKLGSGTRVLIGLGKIIPE